MAAAGGATGILMMFGWFADVVRESAGGLYNSWRIASIGREAGTVFTAWTYTVVVLLVRRDPA